MPFVADMTWDEVAQALAAGTASLLPVGAAAKQHGLHLPMNTDLVQADHIAAELERKLPFLVWPTVTFGYYPAFTAFPGVSLSRATFMRLLTEAVADILRHGTGRVFVIDTGVSTIEPAAEALRPFGTSAVHLRIHDGPRYRAAAQRLATQAFGSHADELETSRMLHIAPRRVHMDRAAATPGGPFAGPLTLANAPSGSYGDPTSATAAVGAQLWQAMFDDLMEAISS